MNHLTKGIEKLKPKDNYLDSVVDGTTKLGGGVNVSVVNVVEKLIPDSKAEQKVESLVQSDVSFQ